MNYKRLWLICKSILIIVFAFSYQSTTAQNIAIVSSDSLISTKRTISGAKRIVKKSFKEAKFEDFYLSLNQLDQLNTAKEIKAAKPDIVITVGSAATQFGKNNFKKTPIIFASVMYPVISGFVESLQKPNSNITGASLNIPADIQFRNFIKIIPDLKKIGVLYSDNTASLIPPAKIIADQLGLQLIAVKVNNEKQLPLAIDSLSNSCNGIWSVADPILFSPQSTKFILLQTIRRGIPFMGFSRNVVESGALFALDFDYKAIGRQAGKTAVKVLEGAEPGDLPVTNPDIIWFHYNEKTARHININIPEEMIAIAKEVYR